MITLNALCADMETSGRYLSSRGARDWWTKGLLPRPRRHGLGRGKGTETFWTEPRVSQQARAAYDLLAAHPRADFALQSLWLLGFPVGLRHIRAIYRKVINRHLRSVHGRAGKQSDDIVGKLAAVLARQQAKASGAPTDAQQAIAELAVEFLGIVYGVDGELVCEGLAALWEKAVPYMAGGVDQPNGFTDLHPRDEDFVTWGRHLSAAVRIRA